MRKQMRNFAVVLFISIFFCACVHPALIRRASNVDFSRNQFAAAVAAQTSFRISARMDRVAAAMEYAGLTGERGGETLVATGSGCYMAVATTVDPVAEINVGAFRLSGEDVNSGLRRNDLYRSSGMAARGFCLGNAKTTFTVRVASNMAAMGFVVALYPVANADVFITAVGRLQNIERRAMAATLEEIIRGADASATLLPWAASFPDAMSQGEAVVSGLPPGATAGMCLLVAAVGAGGSTRDVDIVVFTGTPPITRETLLAADDRVNPNAAVAFKVPADPSTVRVALQSYTGGGPVIYAAYGVREQLCAQGAEMIPIPEGVSTR